MFRFPVFVTAASLSILATSALASTVCAGPNQLCTTIIPTNSNASGTFSNPGPDSMQGYVLQTSDDGTNFTVSLFDASDPNGESGLNFANLYFDTIASTPNTGSNLGFEVGNNDAFIPSTGVKTDLTGSGVVESITGSLAGEQITLQIPNTFFLDDPLNMGFATTPDGTLVSLHLSQSFGYSVAGGSANFPAPVELGDAIVSAASPVPEPSSIYYMATSGLALLGAAGREIKTRDEYSLVRKPWKARPLAFQGFQ